jgi:hypothetical protein
MGWSPISVKVSQNMAEVSMKATSHRNAISIYDNSAAKHKDSAHNDKEELQEAITTKTKSKGSLSVSRDQ